MITLVAKFIFLCAPLVCRLDARPSTGAPVLYIWNWGGVARDTVRGAIVDHVFPKAGLYIVTLTVVDAAGASASLRQLVTVPASGTTLPPPPPPPPPPRTIDTLYLSLPPVHDTVTVIKRDTVTLVTILPSVPPPPPPGGGRTVIEPSPGEFLVYLGATFLGRLVQRSDGAWQAYQYLPGRTDMPCLGIATGACLAFATQTDAREALP